MGSLSDCGLIATDIVEDAVGCDEIANALQRTTGHGERNARNKRRCCDGQNWTSVDSVHILASLRCMVVSTHRERNKLITHDIQIPLWDELDTCVSEYQGFEMREIPLKIQQLQGQGLEHLERGALSKQ